MSESRREIARRYIFLVCGAHPGSIPLVLRRNREMHAREAHPISGRADMIKAHAQFSRHKRCIIKWKRYVVNGLPLRTRIPGLLSETSRIWLLTTNAIKRRKVSRRPEFCYVYNRHQTLNRQRKNWFISRYNRIISGYNRKKRICMIFRFCDASMSEYRWGW